MKLTSRQSDVLAFMWDFYQRNDQLPPPPKICDKFGWRSPNAVTEVRQSLVNHGAIERNEVGKFKFTDAYRKMQAA